MDTPKEPTTRAVVNISTREVGLSFRIFKGELGTAFRKADPRNLRSISVDRRDRAKQLANIREAIDGIKWRRAVVIDENDHEVEVFGGSVSDASLRDVARCYIKTRTGAKLKEQGQRDLVQWLNIARLVSLRYLDSDGTDEWVEREASAQKRLRDMGHSTDEIESFLLWMDSGDMTGAFYDAIIVTLRGAASVVMVPHCDKENKGIEDNVSNTENASTEGKARPTARTEEELVGDNEENSNIARRLLGISLGIGQVSAVEADAVIEKYLTIVIPEWREVIQSSSGCPELSLNFLIQRWKNNEGWSSDLAHMCEELQKENSIAKVGHSEVCILSALVACVGLEEITERYRLAQEVANRLDCRNELGAHIMSESATYKLTRQSCQGAEDWELWLKSVSPGGKPIVCQNPDDQELAHQFANAVLDCGNKRRRGPRLLVTWDGLAAMLVTRQANELMVLSTSLSVMHSALIRDNSRYLDFFTYPEDRLLFREVFRSMVAELDVIETNNIREALGCTSLKRILGKVDKKSLESCLMATEISIALLRSRKLDEVKLGCLLSVIDEDLGKECEPTKVLKANGTLVAGCSVSCSTMNRDSPQVRVTTAWGSYPVITPISDRMLLKSIGYVYPGIRPKEDIVSTRIQYAELGFIELVPVFL